MSWRCIYQTSDRGEFSDFESTVASLSTVVPPPSPCPGVLPSARLFPRPSCLFVSTCSCWPTSVPGAFVEVSCGRCIRKHPELEEEFIMRIQRLSEPRAGKAADPEPGLIPTSHLHISSFSLSPHPSPLPPSLPTPPLPR